MKLFKNAGRKAKTLRNKAVVELVKSKALTIGEVAEVFEISVANVSRLMAGRTNSRIIQITE